MQEPRKPYLTTEDRRKLWDRIEDAVLAKGGTPHQLLALYDDDRRIDTIAEVIIKNHGT